MTRTLSVALVALVLAGGTAGCVTAPPPDGTPPGDEDFPTDDENPPAGDEDRSTVATTPGADALDPVLESLTSADDPAEYARTHGLDYRNGSVRVVVELTADSSLPTGYDVEVEATYTEGETKLVQAFVPVDQLRALAAEEPVERVRTPLRPSTG